MAKLWGGRFTDGIHPAAKTLSYSLDVDARLVHYDIKVNIAHAKGLVGAGVFTQEESDRVVSCLASLDQQFKTDSTSLLGDDEEEPPPKAKAKKKPAEPDELEIDDVGSGEESISQDKIDALFG